MAEDKDDEDISSFESESYDDSPIDIDKTDNKDGKSANAILTITEVSAQLNIAQHVLRFWETRFRHVRPMKRAGGRRYYRPVDIILITKIRDLIYKDGYTIRGVQKLIQEQGIRQFVGVNEIKASKLNLVAPNDDNSNINVIDKIIINVDKSNHEYLHTNKNNLNHNHISIIHEIRSLLFQAQNLLKT